MIVILKPDTPPYGPEVAEVLREVERFPGLSARLCEAPQGTSRRLVEIYLVGPTQGIPEATFSELPCVERVVRVSQKYRLLGRHASDLASGSFEESGVRFDQDTLHVFAGLCAVDTPAHVEQTMAALGRLGLRTTRMGAYKPRTSPYDFQGLGFACLPWVLDSAAKHGVRVIAMEVTHEAHLDEIRAARAKSGAPAGVMVQIGTRNAQNFELLKAVGQQRDFPVLFKRGMGITLEESLNACEYVASEGNRNIVFCLRGVKTHLGDPHRNFVDFSHVPVVHRLTRMPVCVDPSHSVGRRDRGPDGLLEIFHATAQGVVAGANMILVDVHPAPAAALCDGPQALTLDELPRLLDDVAVVREAYEKRRALAGHPVPPEAVGVQRV